MGQIIIPKESAESICTAYKKKPTAAEENTPIPAAPTINAGPELLQKTSRRDASSRLISPCDLSRAVYAAPSGYPPVTPIIKADTPCPDIPSLAPNGASAFEMSFDAPSSFKRFVAMKNGNREGTSTCAHSRSPSRAACVVTSGIISSAAAHVSSGSARQKARIVFFMPSPHWNLCPGGKI